MPKPSDQIRIFWLKPLNMRNLYISNVQNKEKNKLKKRKKNKDEDFVRK